MVGTGSVVRKIDDDSVPQRRLLVQEPVRGARDYGELVTVLDLVADLDATYRPRFDLARLERYVESVLARGAAEPARRPRPPRE